jgi:predicted nucleotidyltransferase
MQQKIKKHLKDLEQEFDIKILLACETGSRAWGFPSPDSDYDVRIIYKHNRDWYLGLHEEKDTIEMFLDNNEVDISGWDLRKSLRLLRKSNAPLLERIQSPIIYEADFDFVKEINDHANENYSRISVAHHYLSMAKKAYDDVIPAADGYKLKRLFYALRASMACLWVLRYDEIPPIEFSGLLDNLDVIPSLKNRILELIDIKSGQSESYLHKGDEEIIKYIKDAIELTDAEASALPAKKGEIGELNKFFVKTVG